MVSPCCFAEPDCLVAVADPGVPCRGRLAKPGKARPDLCFRDVQLGCAITERDPAQRRLAKRRTGRRYAEAGPLQVANGEAGGVRVDEIARPTPTVCVERRIVFPVEQMAIVDEKPRGNAVTQRLGLELLKLGECPLVQC